MEKQVWLVVVSGNSNAPLNNICFYAYIYNDVWATNYINNVKKKMSVTIKSKARLSHR